MGFFQISEMSVLSNLIEISFEILIFILVKRKKKVVKDIIVLTKFETAEQKVTVFTAPLSNYGSTNSNTKK